MEQAFLLANDNIAKAADYNKSQYDRKAHGVELKVGDQVLFRNMRELGDGTGKLTSHWEREVFKVLEKKAELPVYVIENLNKKKDTRTVHRNLLMSCNQLPTEVFEKEKPKDNSVAKSKRKKKVKVVKQRDDGDLETCADVRELVEGDEGQEIIDAELANVVEEMLEEKAIFGEDGEVAEPDVLVDADVEQGDTESSQDADEPAVDISGNGNVSVADDQEIDTTFEAGEEDATSSEEEELSRPVRSSNRIRNPPKTLTYDVPGLPKVIGGTR